MKVGIHLTLKMSIVRYFLVGALLVFAAEPNCPVLEGLDDVSVATFVLNRSTELSTDYLTKTIKDPQTYIGEQGVVFEAFTGKYMTEIIKDPQTYISEHGVEFEAFTGKYMTETIKNPQTYISEHGAEFEAFTGKYMTDTIKNPQTYISEHGAEFEAFTGKYMTDTIKNPQTYISEHGAEYSDFRAAQYEIFVAEYKASNGGANPDDADEQRFEELTIQAFIQQVIAQAYIGQVIVQAYFGQIIAQAYIGQKIGEAFITKVVTEGITPMLTAEIKEYVQGKVEKCLITKGCGAFIVQGNSPTPPIPTFIGTSCTRCIDVFSEEGCKNSTTHTCVWSGGTCSQTNCPTLMNDQFVSWRKSGMSKDEYIEANHAKENEKFTRELCKNFGCVYMPSFYWCSAWSKWALIVTLVVSILFVIAVVVGIVVCCVYKKKNKSSGQTESTAELEHNSSEKKIEESNTQ